MARCAYADRNGDVTSMHADTPQEAVSIAQHWAEVGLHAWARDDHDQVIYDSHDDGF